MNTEGKIYSIVFTFIVSFVFVAILAVVYFSLKPRIDVNQEFQQSRAILNAMNISYKDNAEAVDIFSSSIQYNEANGLYTYKDNQGQTIFVLIEHGDGLWGDIGVVIGINPSKKIITGIAINNQNETPGLGGRIDEQWFKEQFTGEKYSANGSIKMGPPGEGDSDPENSEVDAITGATRTSESIGIIINRGLQRLITAAGGAQ